MQAFLNLRIARFGNDLHGLRRHGWCDILRQGRRRKGKQQHGNPCGAQPSNKLDEVTFRMLAKPGHVFPPPLAGQTVGLCLSVTRLL